MSLAIIPGVLVLCTVVMMLTNGASQSGAYTGEAYEGIALLPAIANKLDFLLQPLFGFSSSSCIAVPITALGSAGTALGIVSRLIREVQITSNDMPNLPLCACAGADL